jgi:RNA polymerase-binding transcription factor DksA
MPKSKPAKAAKQKKVAPAKAAKRAPKVTAKAKKPIKATKPAKKKAPKPVKKEKTVKAEKPEKVSKVLKLVKTNGAKKDVAKKAPEAKAFVRPALVANGAPKPVKNVKMTPFLASQKQKLLELRDSLLDSMSGVAKDTLRSRAEGSEASAFGMHQADAGSDAYDRDFALSLLSQEQDALYEIEEALKRIDGGTYGTCEMSGKPIAHARLEALPFARYTVECQTQLEKQKRVNRTRTPVTSLFGLTDDEGGGSESEEEETTPEPKEEKE